MVRWKTVKYLQNPFGKKKLLTTANYRLSYRSWSKWLNFVRFPILVTLMTVKSLQNRQLVICETLNIASTNKNRNTKKNTNPNTNTNTNTDQSHGSP